MLEMKKWKHENVLNDGRKKGKENEWEIIYKRNLYSKLSVFLSFQGLGMRTPSFRHTLMRNEFKSFGGNGKTALESDIIRVSFGNFHEKKINR